MKTILISAAYSDMAKSTINLLKHDYSLVLIGRQQSSLDLLIGDLNLTNCVKLAIACDISDEQACRNIAESLSANNITLDGLVNFAGLTPIKANFLELENHQLNSDLQVRVFGNLNLIKHFEKFLSNGASIVFVNGILSKLPSADFLSSSISTGAVRSLAKALSKWMAPRRIRVNTVNPCACDTKMKNRLFNTLADKAGIQADAIENAVKSQIPMGRLCEPDDVAHAIKFLLSDGASFISGVALDVDGGYNPNVSSV